MSHLLAQVRLQSDTGLPRDVVINTFHFDTTGDDLLAAAAIGDALDDFYQAIDNTLLGASLNTVGHVIHFYNFDDVPPRVPILIFPLTNFVTASTAGPRESALCLSFKQTALSGENQARRRGRVFIGPLAQIVSADGLISSGTIAILANAGGNLLAASVAASNWKWVVFSVADNTTYEVDSGWVDNETDTIRKRQLRATLRDTF